LGPSDIPQLIFLVVLLMLSAFFSSAETALTTVNKIRMRTLAESGDKRADRVLRVTDDSGKMLSAILIGNNIVTCNQVFRKFRCRYCNRYSDAFDFNFR